MKLMIDIHEKDYQSVLNGHIPFSVLDAFKNGTPLEAQPTATSISDKTNIEYAKNRLAQLDKAFIEMYMKGYEFGLQDWFKSKTQPTDAVRCDCTTEEIAKSFIEDVEVVKDQLDGQSIDAVSREAVLHLYKTFWRCFVDAENADIYMNAIRALPPVTPRTNLARTSQDCIGREETKRFLYERIDRLNDDELYDIFSRIIDDMYNELPPVTPERPKGKWMAIENEDMNIVGYYCSCCDLPMETEEKTKYCPNCGTEMSGGGEE